MSFFKLENKKTVLNMFSFYLINISNYLIPIFTIPYLARILTPSKLGVLGISQSLSVIIFIFLDFGHTLFGVRDTAQNIDNPYILSKKISMIYFVKCLGLIIILFVMSIIYFNIEFLQDEKKYFLPAIINGIALAFTPIWYFQAKEKLGLYSLWSFILKLGAVLVIFISVKDASQGWYVILAQSIVSLLLLIGLLVSVMRELNWVQPQKSEFYQSVEKSIPIFLFSISTSLYSSASMVLLKFFVSPIQVGFFNGADKIQKFFMGIISPAERAFLPRALGTKNNENIFKISLFVLGGIGLFGFIIIFFFADWLIPFILGPGYEYSIPLVKILSIQLPITGVSRVMGVQQFMALKKDILLTKIVASIGLIHILLLIIFIPVYGTIAMAWSIVLTEIILLVIYGLYYFNRKNNLGIK